MPAEKPNQEVPDCVLVKLAVPVMPGDAQRAARHIVERLPDVEWAQPALRGAGATYDVREIRAQQSDPTPTPEQVEAWRSIGSPLPPQCSVCDGTGRVGDDVAVQAGACPACGGSGVKR